MSAETIPAARVSKLGPVALPLCGPALLSVVSGCLRARCRVSEDVIRLAERDVIVVQPGHVVELTGLEVTTEVVLVEVGDAWAEQAAQLACVEVPEQPVPLFVDRAGSPTARRVERLLAELAASSAREDASERLRRLASVVALLAVVVERRTKVLEAGARGARSRRASFRSAVEGLASGSLEDVSLERFAAGIGLSPRQVSRLFREELGTTFRDHRAELRLERAKQLLEQSDESIIAVAGATGWSSLAHFNAVFRKRIGVTPSGYRARLPRGAGAS